MRALWISISIHLASACSTPENWLDVNGARAEWESPRTIQGGGELPALTILADDDCDDVTFEVHAFRDADGNGIPDDAGGESLTRGRLDAQNRTVEIERFKVLGSTPLYWRLVLRTPRERADVELGHLR